MCVLCPRQYQESIVPDYKNPKLLSQFVSPHTGNVYQSHITGLCKYMQVCIIKFKKSKKVCNILSLKKNYDEYIDRGIMMIFKQWF